MIAVRMTLLVVISIAALIAINVAGMAYNVHPVITVLISIGMMLVSLRELDKIIRILIEKELL